MVTINYLFACNYVLLMKHEILNLFKCRGTLLQPQALNYIMSLSDPIRESNRILNSMKQCPLFITLEDVMRYTENTLASDGGTCTLEKSITESLPLQKENDFSLLEKDEKQIHKSDNLNKIEELKSSGISPPWHPIAKDYSVQFKKGKDITGNSTCCGDIKDFAQYFCDRFNQLKKLLRARRELAGAVKLERAKKQTDKFATICIIVDIKTTKNGHRILEVEDDSDTASVLVKKDSKSANLPLVKDEVIGIIGSPSRQSSGMFHSQNVQKKYKNEEGPILYADEIILPDVPRTHEPHFSKEPVAAAFVSDIHVGSKTFLEKEFNRFLKWLNGKLDYNRDIAGKIKYLVIPGDVVDGIGVFPGQYEELQITDVFLQYEKFANLLQNIPDYIQVIILPGNHDVVRPAEPQPTFPNEIAKLFDKRFILLGNPATFSIHGVDVLAYHGRSFDDLIMAIQGLTYNTPIDAMKELLRMRHLVPIYGEKTPIAPEHSDMLVIDSIPDIFVTGHVHDIGTDYYNGITLINASAWQSQTSYQKMLNFNPNPCKVPIVDLQTLKVTNVLDFAK
ncbi:MAG: DNA-directed DNA polymerase II small subunit [Thermoplasmata archaeon]